ncbi:hypothetical protein BX600DRAFT_516376 [Xylariales sp. PMI_506]|nr:hypothetical protein BX600DRAFT_516376 [Xylariales sp. PMI_506]
MADLSPTSSPSSPQGRWPAIRRHLRASSPSPTRQRPGDALLSSLSPPSAVEALRAPSGALKACLTDASVSEQMFAIRAAVASKKIHDWLEELSDWPWPSESTSAGFEMPPIKRRRLFEAQGSADQDGARPPSSGNIVRQVDYLGSLPAGDVVQYEVRIDQIHQEMEELNLEDIKSQVLHNHILPLSRPGTPFSDAGRSLTRSLSFVKMEDMTAIITAITVQALPNISKLSRLLNVWTVRIVVLRKVPTVLTMITDAEIALKAGWNAIKVDTDETLPSTPGGRRNDSHSTSSLSREDFDVMNVILQKKISKPGRDLDYMLDALEGMRDTLPEDWLDRMDAVERDYAEWVATAERRVRQGEWLLHHGPEVLPAEPATPRPRIQIQSASPAPTHLETTGSRASSSPMTHSSVTSQASRGPSFASTAPTDEQNEIEDLKAPHAVEEIVAAKSFDQAGPLSPATIDRGGDDYETKHSGLIRDYDGTGEERPQEDIDAFRSSPPSSYDIHNDPDVSHETSMVGESVEGASTIQENDYAIDDALTEVDHNIVRITSPDALEPSPILYRKFVPTFEGESSFLESVYEEDEDSVQPDLPPARFEPRRVSQASAGSTMDDQVSPMGHLAVRNIRENSVDPELPRLPDPDEPFSSDAPSPPSSPPLRYAQPSASESFSEMPELDALTVQDDTPPRSPLEPPEAFDAESSFDYGSQIETSGRRILSPADNDKLHQQISQVLKSLPNKIRLTSKPTVNLNPPDLQLPSRPKSTRASEPFRRSGSALSTRSTMSSRSSTPSFLLAPARPPRPQSRASHEAKTYYLSRSTGEAPMKLLIRCVGENGERVMVRVGGGWADLGEYLKEYAVHHGRRSKGEGKVEVRDLPTGSSRVGSSPASRPGSALDSPMTPLAVRKTRKSVGEEGSSRMLPVTPLGQAMLDSNTPSSDASRVSHGSNSDEDPDNSLLGMSGPHPKKGRAMSQESRQWVEDVKTKVRTVSSEQRHFLEQAQAEGKFGDMGKVGGTKRVFRKSVGSHN